MPKSGGSSVLPSPRGPDATASATRTGASAEATNPPVGSSQWRDVLAELDRRRAAVLAEQDPARLSTYARPGSTAWQDDAALMAELAESGLHPEGLTSKVLTVEQVELDGSRALLRVVDQRSGYELVDSAGAVVQRVEASGSRPLVSRAPPAGCGLSGGGLPGGRGRGTGR